MSSLVFLPGGRIQDVESFDTERSISPRTACDRGPTPTVGHVKALHSAASSPPIVKALTSVIPGDTPPRPSTSTMLNVEGHEEPCMDPPPPGAASAAADDGINQ